MHVALQLLHSLGLVRIKEVAEFCAKYEAATLLRNKMDHLDGLVGNLVKSKNPTPIFGALSYVLVTPDQIVTGPEGLELSGCLVVTLLAGSVRGGVKQRILNPAGRTVRTPVSWFQFEAFDQVLEIESAVNDLFVLMAATDGHVEHLVREQAASQAVTLGMPVEKLLVHSPVDLTSRSYALLTRRRGSNRDAINVRTCYPNLSPPFSDPEIVPSGDMNAQ